MLIPILLIVLISCTALLFWQFVGYPLFMDSIVKNEAEFKKDYSYQPFITVLVPTYNEGTVIKQRIENLTFQNYPTSKFEVLVIDSGSTDSTAPIVKQYAERSSQVRLIEEGVRRGKASAINLGKSMAQGEIILVTDANTLFDPDVLREIGPYFKDPLVGAVGGKLILSNANNGLVNASSFYWDIESLLRRCEWSIDSACLFHGEINAWRKEIVEANTKSLSEDLDMALKIIEKGYKIAYEPKAIAYEPGPTSTREQITQKKRTALGTIQTFFLHRRYLCIPKDKYRFLIFPSHKLLQIFSPFFLLGCLAALLCLLIFQKMTAIGIYLVITGLSFSISLILLNRKISKLEQQNNTPKGRLSFIRLFGILRYVLLHEYIVLLAWKDYVLGHYSVKWEKAQSNR